MPCHAAMTKKVIIVKEDETIEKLLPRMEKENINTAIVTDKKGILLGLFTLKDLLRNAAPVNISMGGSLGGNIQLESAPGIAKRLLKIKPLAVREFINRKIQIVHPETPTWEGLKLLLDQENPLVVIDHTSQKPLGLITENSILDELERMQD
jgi:predicted transcriptional regulator